MTCPSVVTHHTAQPKQLYITLLCVCVRSNWFVFPSVSLQPDLLSLPETIQDDVLCCAEECALTGQATCRTYLLWAERSCRYKLHWSHTHTGRPKSQSECLFFFSSETSWTKLLSAQSTKSKSFPISCTGLADIAVFLRFTALYFHSDFPPRFVRSLEDVM